MTGLSPAVAKLVGIALVVLGALAIYGVWQKPEQTRPLSYDKGVYGGQADQALDDGTVELLRQRASRYRNSGL